MRAAVRAVVLAVAAAGCAVNPVSGRHEIVLMSEERERELGRKEAAEVEAVIGLVKDGRIDVYVGAVGARLAEGSARRDLHYTFHVADLAEANAFALPGGHVYVSRGLLALMDGEDELACVMGHEMAHVEARHAVQRATRSAPIGIVTGLGAAVAGLVSPLLGNLVGGAGDLTRGLLIAPYSRGQEHEADRVGEELAARAGWDPAALARALETLEREEAASGARPGATSFLATHPTLPDRVVQARRRAAELVPAARTPIASSRADFLSRLDGLVIGTDAGGGVLAGRTFLHPDFDLALLLPEGWETRNGRVALASRAPDGRALVALEAVGQGTDPAEAVAAFEKATESRVSDRAERVTINGLPALRLVTRARADGGALGVDLTWIAHRGTFFRMTGVARAQDFDAYAAVFRRTAETFRPLTESERAGIRETRLRIVPARGGERLDQLAARVGSEWKPPMVAAANALDPSAPLGDGQLVKVAISEPYRVGR
jgi:predicted Zn-dependent protease